MASIALQTATLKALIFNGVLTPRQARDAINDALSMVERSQGTSPRLREVRSIAKRLIEEARFPLRRSKK
jgi:hypothetical protein